MSYAHPPLPSLLFRLSWAGIAMDPRRGVAKDPVPRECRLAIRVSHGGRVLVEGPTFVDRKNQFMYMLFSLTLCPSTQRNVTIGKRGSIVVAACALIAKHLVISCVILTPL